MPACKKFFGGKIMVKNFNRAAVRLIGPPLVLEVSDILFFLGINGNNRYAFGMRQLALAVYIFKLGVTVGMGFGRRKRFLVRLQTVAQHFEHFPDHPVTRFITFFRQTLFKVPKAFVCP
jgi:hypothetical protein